MKEKKDIEKLVSKLNSLEPKKGNKRTEFLEDPKVKKVLIEKLNEGVSMKAIIETMKEAGYDISLVSLRSWMKENNIKKKKSKKTKIY